MTPGRRVQVEIAGVRRALPIHEVSPGTCLGILQLAGDYELTEAAGRALAARMPEDVDVIVMPDGKAQVLLHVVQRESRRPAVLLRKERKSYLLEPVYEVAATSVTTSRVHAFYLGYDDVTLLRGRTVAILDDVVSTGGTLDAVRRMLDRCGVQKSHVLAVATEGQPRPDVISLVHLEVIPC